MVAATIIAGVRRFLDKIVRPLLQALDASLFAGCHADQVSTQLIVPIPPPCCDSFLVRENHLVYAYPRSRAPIIPA